MKMKISSIEEKEKECLDKDHNLDSNVLKKNCTIISEIT